MSVTRIPAKSTRPPAEMIALATALIGAERSTLEGMASVGRLLTAAAEANIASGVSITSAEGIFALLEQASASPFDQLKTLGSTHRTLLAMGEKAVKAGFSDGSWLGPDESCMILRLAELGQRRAA